MESHGESNRDSAKPEDFTAMVQSAVAGSLAAEAAADALALAAPPKGVEFKDYLNRIAIRVHPGPLHPSHRITAALAVGLGLAAMVATAVTVSDPQGSFLPPTAAAVSWLALLLTIHQLILLRSIATITVDDARVTVTRRGLAGQQHSVFDRRAIVAVHTSISHLATTDEASVFDLVFLVRDLDQEKQAPPPNASSGFERRKTPRGRLEIILDGRPRDQLAWVAARLRLALHVGSPPAAWPAPHRAPRWPMSVIRRMKRPVPLTAVPAFEPAADIGLCVGCGYNLHGLADRRTCPECGEPFRLGLDGQRIG